MLDRRADVYKLETEERVDDLDTLPFISHHTLNIARDVLSEFSLQAQHTTWETEALFVVWSRAAP